jgi:hypothetical protein
MKKREAVAKNLAYWVQRAERAEQQLSAIRQRRKEDRQNNKKNPFIAFRIPLAAKEVLAAWGKKQIDEFEHPLSAHQAARRLLLPKIKQIQLEP